MVDRSIIMDPSDGSYLIRKEWKANVLDNSTSTYFNAYNKLERESSFQ